MPPPLFTLTLNPAIDRTVTVPGFKLGKVNRVETSRDRAGGKGINVAAALAAHGYPVAALGFLGGDNDADFATLFALRGITDRCLRLPGATRVGIKIFDSLSGETTDLNFPGLTLGSGEVEVLRGQLAELARGGGWCVLAGSLPPGVDPKLYAELITTLKAHGVRTVLDTSGAALPAALRAGPDIIKPNQHELEALVGRALPTEAAVIAAARGLVAGGVGLVVVSRGAEGACFVTDEAVLVARPPAVTVGSTVGAGDAMVAGLVIAQIRGASIADTARFATACALAALTAAAGATDGELRERIAALEPRVELVEA